MYINNTAITEGENGVVSSLRVAAPKINEDLRVFVCRLGGFKVK